MPSPACRSNGRSTPTAAAITNARFATPAVATRISMKTASRTGAAASTSRSTQPQSCAARLAKRSWKREHVAIGTVTDPYQPIEGRYRVTRGILEALRDYASPASITTRSPLVVRDIDVLTQLARKASVSVSISIATLDEKLAREIEPTVAPPRSRLRAVRMLADAGIEVNVALAPVLPRMTDTAGINRCRRCRCTRGRRIERLAQHALSARRHARGVLLLFAAIAPELIAEYATFYRGTFAPKAISEQIDARVRVAMQRTPARTLDIIHSEAPVQISFL